MLAPPVLLMVPATPSAIVPVEPSKVLAPVLFRFRASRVRLPPTMALVLSMVPLLFRSTVAEPLIWPALVRLPAALTATPRPCITAPALLLTLLPLSVSLPAASKVALLTILPVTVRLRSRFEWNCGVPLPRV